MREGKFVCEGDMGEVPSKILYFFKFYKMAFCLEIEMNGLCIGVADTF